MLPPSSLSTGSEAMCVQSVGVHACISENGPRVEVTAKDTGLQVGAGAAWVQGQHALLLSVQKAGWAAS